MPVTHPSLSMPWFTQAITAEQQLSAEGKKAFSLRTSLDWAIRTPTMKFKLRFREEIPPNSSLPCSEEKSWTDNNASSIFRVSFSPCVGVYAQTIALLNTPLQKR